MNGAPTVVTLAGELDIARRKEMAAALRLRGGEHAVLLDLDAVTYADSTALSELLRFRGEAETAGVRLALLIGSRQLARIVQYAALRGVFAIFEDRAAALRYLTASS
jgi:anti-anti-sigma factor